jgi:hypothetical protein
MALEKRLVDSHILYSNDPLSDIHLYDLIDQQERIPVRKCAHDLLDAKHDSFSLDNWI